MSGKDRGCPKRPGESQIIGQPPPPPQSVASAREGGRVSVCFMQMSRSSPADDARLNVSFKAPWRWWERGGGIEEEETKERRGRRYAPPTPFEPLSTPRTPLDIRCEQHAFQAIMRCVHIPVRCAVAHQCHPEQKKIRRVTVQSHMGFGTKSTKCNVIGCVLMCECVCVCVRVCVCV